ncbi:TPA: hypothetical protein N0F65_010353 [Lagenidium giganteum]|uniref:Uncharacterized protein n=1 Tax=Lagenidium giganteum TaxID=4803 RepID=A0AAV2Z4U7_9STRA|nr:TPA: hypothetical protein N0F65_010353 [Lagenidium giganteum]
MASEMTSAFREVAMKKLSEAKQKGATLATATAATAASIKSNVPASTSFVFRTSMTAQAPTDVSLEAKLDQLRDTNNALRRHLAEHPTTTLDASINKLDLINESLAFTIENIQECAHVIKLLHRQFKDVAALQSELDTSFYQTNKKAESAAEISSADAAPAVL